MRKPLTSVFVVVSLIACSLSGLASAQTPRELKNAAKVRASVAKFGSGPKVRVIVLLADGDTVKGYVKSIGEDSFIVELAKNEGPLQIPYMQVKEIRKKPTTGSLIAMIAGAGAASVGILYLTGFLLSKCAPCMGP